MSAAEEPVGPAPDSRYSRPTGDVVSTGWLSAKPMFGESQAFGSRRAGAAGASLVLHGIVLLIVAAVFTYQATTAEPPRLDSVPLVFVNEAGPGGGGGGNPAPAPPKPVVAPKSEPPPAIRFTPPPPVPPPPTPPPPIPSFSAPVMTPDATLAQASGTNVLAAPTPVGGGGQGTGIGPGSGRGLGPGTEAGFGGGAYRPGAGIRSPTVLKEVKPQYTSDALRVKIQGSVQLEAVVRADGTVGDVRVTRSLDRVHGLDQEAIKAARQWLFTPATREGKPVPIVVVLELTFTIH